VVVAAEAEIRGGREADTGGSVMIVPQVSFQEVPFDYVELAPFLTLEPFIALGLSFVAPHGVLYLRKIGLTLCEATRDDTMSVMCDFVVWSLFYYRIYFLRYM
jgi:hypothetical protein